MAVTAIPPDMPLQPVYLLILAACTCIILYAVSNLYGQNVCVQCGGRGSHRKDCPSRHD